MVLSAEAKKAISDALDALVKDVIPKIEVYAKTPDDDNLRDLIFASIKSVISVVKGVVTS